MLTKEFVAAGNAIFTLEISGAFAEAHDLPAHYTFRVTRKGEDANPVYFVSLLTGPDNTADYTYVGILNPATGDVRLTKKSAYPAEAMVVRLLRRTLAVVWKGDAAKLTDAGFDLHHVGRCGRCGRPLTVPASIASGIGPDCAEKMFAA